MVHPLRVGLKLAPQHTGVDELRAVWRIADEAGFDHVWNFDHFASIGPQGPEHAVLEGWTLLGAMAEATKRVRIGCMVTGNTYRHPGVLAKMAVTVDHLSDGRLEFGIGAAWAEIEHEMLDLQFGTAGERIARLAEACILIKGLWTQERTTFEGFHYTITDAIANPKPVQAPHPPIWIGGSGERKTLRVVAEHADVWNISEKPIDEAIRLGGVLDAHCDAVGRDPAEIRRSVQILPSPTADEFLAKAEAYLKAGFTELVVYAQAGTAERDAEHAAAEILPRLRRLA